jgi:hypothetical protein
VVKKKTTKAGVMNSLEAITDSNDRADLKHFLMHIIFYPIFQHLGFFLFCFGSTGVVLTASHLLGRCSTTLAIFSALFALVIFQIGSQLMPRLA